MEDCFLTEDFMPVITYKTRGTCARAINIEVENGVVKNVEFVGGCSGNTQGVARLVEGMDAETAIIKLSGIRCGFKDTSCPDQLAKALSEMTKQND
jgi:uncharacterized protein (TIGR03905 family)